MNKIKKFVSKLLKDYFNDADKQELIEILTVSLEEKVEDLVENGTPVEEAIDQSIKEFGSTEDVLEAFSDQSSQLQLTLRKSRKSQLMFSLYAYLIIVGLTVFINLAFLAFFKEVLWFVIVAIALLFWPLIMGIRFYMVKK